MAERRFKLGAHHVALLAVIAVAAILAINLLRPVQVGDWGPGDDKRTLGLLSDEQGILDDRAQMETGLELARAVLCGAEPSRNDYPALTGFEGRRVFVVAYGQVFPAPVATGKGETLYDSIVDGAAQLREASRTRYDKLDPAEVRLMVEVITGAERKKLKPEVYLPPRQSIGVWGMLMEDAEGQLAYLTGSEMVEQELYHDKKHGLPTGVLVDRLEDRAGSGAVIAPESSFSRFSSRSFIEGPRGEGIVELYRSHTRPNDEPTAYHLALSSRAAADYLARIIDEQGEHNYSYDAHTDRDSKSYNLLRHAGSTYALMQAYDRFRDPAYKAAAERSFEYLLSRTQLTQERGLWGDDFRYLVEDRKAKLGGSGLALVALCQYTEATGDRRYLDTMREFARFIVKMQDPDSGKLNSYYDYGPTAEVPDKDSIYYPGESLYGLGKLYYIDPNPLWLDTAVKGANWLIFDRDADKPPLKLPHDHWLMMALSYLYAHTRDDAYKTHCYHIAEAIESKHRGPDDEDAREYVDYLGTYYKVARVTPVGCRVEGLVGAADLAKLAGDEYQWLQTMAVRSTGFSMTIQFDPINSYWLPNPDKALGGIRAGIYENDIRNDYVQHNLSGFIGAERLLLAEQGVTVPGGPAWHERIVRTGNDFAGYPPEDADEAWFYPGRELFHMPYAGIEGQPLIEAVVADGYLPGDPDHPSAAHHYDGSDADQGAREDGDEDE